MSSILELFDASLTRPRRNLEMFSHLLPRISGIHLRLALNARHNSSSIQALQAAFRDPSSPFYIQPGTQGPASPDEYSNVSAHTNLTTSASGINEEQVSNPLEEAYKRLLASGLDPASFWEQRIAWGDQDAFQHVNNVRYLQFFESARIKWMMSLGNELGGPSKAEEMIKGVGISIILKSIDVNFRRPVTYPDTLLIGYKPLASSLTSTDSATFQVTASAYSLSQKAFVAHSKEFLVWYDYENLKKCDPGEEIKGLILRRTDAMNQSD